MSKLLKSKFFLGVMIVAVMLVVGATSASAAYMHTTTLKLGSTGSQVMSLQQALNAAGFPVSLTGAGSPGMESTYFGAKTRGAVVQFQTARGLGKDGIVGPNTGAALGGVMSGNFPAGCTSAAGYSTVTGLPCVSGPSTGLPAGCSSTVGYSPTTGHKCDGSSTPSTPSTGPLSGDFGTISAMTQLSQYSGEEVGAGSNETKVMGFEVEASDDGDIQLSAIKLVFDATGNASTDSDRLIDYIDSVAVWQGSDEVGSADSDDFTKVSTGIYSKIVVLSDAIVRSGDKDSFYVTVDAVSNLDSGDIDSDSWTVAVENVRVVDGSGVTTTDTSSVPAAIDYDNAGDGVEIAFVTFSSAADTELKLSTNNTPDATTIEVDTSDNTDDVVMLKGEIEIEGTSDVWLDELPVTLTATGDSPMAMTGNVSLIIDGKTFNETVSTSNASTATITFDNLDLDISAGDTISFTVTADLNDIEDTGAATTDFDEGDQLTISLSTTNRAAIIAENEQGDQLTDSTEMTGSVVGNTMTFRSTGVNVVMGTPTYTNVSDQNGVVTQQTFTIPVSVTAFGDKLFLGQSAQFAATATASNAFAVVFENSGTPTTADVTSSASIALSTTNALIESAGFALDEGVTKNFTIEVTQTTPGLLGAVTAGNYRVRIDDVRYFTDSGLSSTATATSADLLPTSSFRTSFKYITS